MKPCLSAPSLNLRSISSVGSNMIEELENVYSIERAVLRDKWDLNVNAAWSVDWNLRCAV